MLKTICFITTALIILSCNQLDCASVHTGKFIIDDNSEDPSIITRTKQHQIEGSIDNSQSTVLAIEWIAECEYVLTFEKGESYGLPIGYQMNCFILEMTDSTHTVQCESQNFGPTEHTLKRIR